MSVESYSYLIGYFRGKAYTLVVRPDYRDINNVSGIKDSRKVSVNIYFRKSEESHEIVRIDNAHGKMHIHRFYTARDDHTEEVDMDFWEAVQYVQENWQEFARLYDENHL